MLLGLNALAISAHSKPDKGVMTFRLNRKRIAITF